MVRLIDADRLLRDPYFQEDRWPESHLIRMAVGEQRTVDAVPVVHGRWIDEYPFVRCSVCNAEWLNCRTDNEPNLFYYCPNCGAKMDLGEEWPE